MRMRPTASSTSARRSRRPTAACSWGRTSKAPPTGSRSAPSGWRSERRWRQGPACFAGSPSRPTSILRRRRAARAGSCSRSSVWSWRSSRRARRVSGAGPWPSCCRPPSLKSHSTRDPARRSGRLARRAGRAGGPCLHGQAHGPGAVPELLPDHLDRSDRRDPHLGDRAGLLLRAADRVREPVRRHNPARGDPADSGQPTHHAVQTSGNAGDHCDERYHHWPPARPGRGPDAPAHRATGHGGSQPAAAILPSSARHRLDHNVRGAGAGTPGESRLDSAGPFVTRKQPPGAEFDSFVSDPPPPALDSNLTVGGMPSARSLLRVDLPRAIRDSTQIVRATLILVPAVAAQGVPGDSFFVAVNQVAADFGAKSALSSSTALHPDSAPAFVGKQDTVTVEVTNFLRAWQNDTTIPRTLLLRQVIELPTAGSRLQEGATFSEIRFYSSRAPGYSPALQLTYIPRYPFGTP